MCLHGVYLVPVHVMTISERSINEEIDSLVHRPAGLNENRKGSSSPAVHAALTTCGDYKFSAFSLFSHAHH